MAAFGFDLVLVPVDGSEPADAALDHALEIASDHGATVHLLYVADTNEPSLVRFGKTVVDVLEREGEEVLSAARERVEARNVPVLDDVLQGDPREVIVETAAADIVDLVVMGAHGRRGLGEFLLGSVTEHVVTRSDVPVMTVRADEDATHAYPYDGVLVPTDGSDHAMTALRLATEIATRHDASLHALSVVDETALGVGASSTAVVDELEQRARTTLDDAASVASNAGVDDIVTSVAFGSVPREIRSVADVPEVDLVVMGTHGQTGLDHLLLGSVTERVLRTAPVPVLTTRPAPADDDG